MIERENFSRKEVEGKYTSYWIWDNIPENHIPTEEHIEKRVFIAGFLKTEKFTLKKIHYSGEKSWPEDGYTVRDIYGQNRDFFKQEVRVHPEEYIIKRAKKKIILKKRVRIEDIKSNIKEISKLKKKLIHK